MGRLGAMFAVILAMCFAAHASAAPSTECKLVTSGYTSFFGAKASGAKFVDHSNLVHLGPVKSVSLFYSKSAGCLRGAKVVIAGTTNLPGVVGTAVNTTEIVLKLSPGEFINKAEVKAEKCIEYIKVFTNLGRSAAAGVVGGSPQPSQVAPPAGGRLVSLRGFHTMNGTIAGHLQQLQLVWGMQHCSAAVAVAGSESKVSVAALREADPSTKTQETKPAKAAAPDPAPAKAPVDAKKNNSATSSSSRTSKPSNSSTTTTSSSNSTTSKSSTPVAAKPAPPAAKNTDPTKCAAKIDMCNEKASMNQFSYCIWNPPFTKSACKGGCCFSSGKCASSSCTLSGMGRDVANMICYGTNSGVGFGGTDMCAGLACKLANPGCTTDAFGGNCVGTVVPFGSKDLVSHQAKKYIGATCLDATPSDTTLDVNGHPAENKGIYMGKLWTICDCSDQVAEIPDLGATFLNFTTAGLNNVTKNDMMLAVSQLLPKINLTDILKLGDEKKEGTELFPSFTELFQIPQLPTITMPGFLSNNSSNSSAPALQLPSLQTLLSQFATKINSSSSSSSTPEAATPESAAITPESAAITPESAATPVTPASLQSPTATPEAPSPGPAPALAAANSSEGDNSNPLAGIKNFLSSILPAIQAMSPNSTTSTSKSNGSAADGGQQVAQAPSSQELMSQIMSKHQAQPVDSEVTHSEGQDALFKITV